MPESCRPGRSVERRWFAIDHDLFVFFSNLSNYREGTLYHFAFAFPTTTTAIASIRGTIEDLWVERQGS